MGWMLVTGAGVFYALPTDVCPFIIIGGGLYSIGIIFYLWQKYSCITQMAFFCTGCSCLPLRAVLLAV